MIINLAPTGAVADKGRNPNVPICTDTIVADVVKACELGIAIAHLHVRDDQGAPSSDPARFSDLLSRLRSESACSDLILCATTSGRHGQSVEQRAAVLALPRPIRPDMASLTLGSLNFPGGASVNSPQTIRHLAGAMLDFGVKPELEVFDLGMIVFAKQLIREGLLKPPYYFNLILGNVGSLQADVQHIACALAGLPDESTVCLGGIGADQARAIAFAVACADGVRVGLEDNLWLDADRTPATNPLLVARVLHAAAGVERAISTPAQVRERLGLT